MPRISFSSHRAKIVTGLICIIICGFFLIYTIRAEEQCNQAQSKMLGDVILSDQGFANLRDGMIASRLQMEELLKSSDFAQSGQMSLNFLSDKNSIEAIKESFDPSKLSARSDQLVGEIFWRNGCDILQRSIEFYSTPVGSNIAKYIVETSEFVENTQSGFELAIWRLSLSGDDKEYRKKG